MGWVEDALNKYADGRDLDPSAAKELLSAYPELWKQWQAKVYAPDALERMGTGGIERYHSRVYLERVVAEHLHLTAGGDCPDAALETRCAEIAGRSPQVATERKEWLSDPWVRAGWSQKTLARYYDPEWLEGYVSTCLEDPYSPRSLEASEKAREVRLLLSQGGTLSSVDPETGEEECVIEVAEPRPEDLADFN